MPVEKSLTKRRGKAKVKIAEKRKMTKAMLEAVKAQDVDVEVSLIQALIPIGLKAVEDKLLVEVERLAGKKNQHGKENVRWGEQDGSVYLLDQKVPMRVPRVRNKVYNLEVPLEAYHQMQEPHLADKQTMLKLLYGISTHKYAKAAALAPEVFGISASNLSKRFKKNTAEMVRKLKSRSLSGHDFVCVFIDAKRYAKEGLFIALGIMIDGQKMILDIDHACSENAAVLGQFFDRLIERGLKFEDGLLFIVDGSKGIIKAIEDKFQEYGFIQRCQWHKTQNVTSYLNESQQQVCKRRMQDAYKQTTYKEAKKELEKLHKELSVMNQSAANSLMEGLEETLTLHQLGLSPELCKSLNSTNCIESIMGQLGQYTDKVDRWQNSYQLLRWAAASLLDVEPNLRKIRGYRYLGVLRFKMQEEIKKRKKKKYGQQESLLETVREVEVPC